MRAEIAAFLACALLAGGAAAPFASSPASAGPALLFEAENGKVLYAEDQDNLWYPASLTKIMTTYLAFEALKTGRLTPEQKITVSEKATLQEPSKVGLPAGATLTVDLAIKALVVKSANDVAVMLAEAIGGNEEAFVKLMNDTAKRLGMTRTSFVNANGLPAPDQVTTARDLAKLSRAVMKEFPEHSALWALPEVRIGKIKLATHNHLLKTFEGADGIKTGFICDSGFNVVSSATRDGRKLIAVVLGEPSGRERSIRAASLLDYGFQTQGWKQLFNTTTIDSLPIAEDAKPVQSVRNTVTGWSCSNRPRPLAKKPVKKKSGTAVAGEAAKGKAANKALNKAVKAKSSSAPAEPLETGSTQVAAKAKPASKPPVKAAE